MPVVKGITVMFGGPHLDVLHVPWIADPPLSRYTDDPIARGSFFDITGLNVQGVPEPRFGGHLDETP